MAGDQSFGSVPERRPLSRSAGQRLLVPTILDQLVLADRAGRLGVVESSPELEEEPGEEEDQDDGGPYLATELPDPRARARHRIS